MSRAACIPCEESCAGLACSCACHRITVLPGPMVVRATPRSVEPSLQERRETTAKELAAAARAVLGARGAARKGAEAELADVLMRANALGL